KTHMSFSSSISYPIFKVRQPHLFVFQARLLYFITTRPENQVEVVVSQPFVCCSRRQEII
ncbi:hypothetical protein MK805_17525, partial [Shimazuella sp. AN120528]|uniref:hypothetical protein n=1 Tax=Shimazuella soli TaxID=1892854 RepID=UPI001F10FFA6